MHERLFPTYATSFYITTTTNGNQSFDHCTQPLGSIRQNVYSCITCNPPPENPEDPYNPAGICYSCSIACHGEHTLVELFARRNFTCDCGTTRLPDDSPCTLRIDPATGVKGPVHGQEPAKDNIYNQNYRNRFCGCGEWYDAEKQKGTMYQCLGLAMDEGGCGEDWWHPECLVGLPRDWYKVKSAKDTPKVEAKADTINTDRAEPTDGESATHTTSEEQADAKDEEDHPTPPGFPDEDDFDTLICYKCVKAAPFVKIYGGHEGFTVLRHTTSQGKTVEAALQEVKEAAEEKIPKVNASSAALFVEGPKETKRKAQDEADIPLAKRIKNAEDKDPDLEDEVQENGGTESCPLHGYMLPPLEGSYSILTRDDDFRTVFCRCKECYPRLKEYPQLLEEEETYEPPVSENGDAQGTASVGTGSLLERGEAALSNVDRVRAIEGVMVYNHLKDKVKSFLQPFAESGQAVGAEDIKAYFEKLRGDSEDIRAAGGAALAGGGEGPDGDNRHEQSGE
jgi:E3 ubiquitin-protein ligase UBR7